MQNRHRLFAVATVAALAMLAGCAGKTSLSSTWTAPNARLIRFDKTLVVFMNASDITRELIENQLAGRIAIVRWRPTR